MTKSRNRSRSFTRGREPGGAYKEEKKEQYFLVRGDGSSRAARSRIFTTSSSSYTAA